VDIDFISLEAAAVLSYIILFFNNGMMAGPSMVDPVRHPYYFIHEANPYAEQWLAFVREIQRYENCFSGS